MYPKLTTRLSKIEIVHFRQEFQGFGSRKKSQLGVVTQW